MREITPLAGPSERAKRLVLVAVGVVLALLVLAVVVAVQAVRSLGWSPGASTVHVIGRSMAPTLNSGDYLLVHPYSGSGPRPGDIVVMRDPYDQSRLFITRVVARPGQTILIRNARVIVDGRPLDEPYAASEPWTVSTSWPPSGSAVTLGPDQYFVLGDNRDHAADSRFFGPVRRDAIRGRAVRVLLPSERARWL